MLGVSFGDMIENMFLQIYIISSNIIQAEPIVFLQRSYEKLRLNNLQFCAQ